MVICCQNNLTLLVQARKQMVAGGEIKYWFENQEHHLGALTVDISPIILEISIDKQNKKQTSFSLLFCHICYSMDHLHL